MTKWCLGLFFTLASAAVIAAQSAPENGAAVVSRGGGLEMSLADYRAYADDWLTPANRKRILSSEETLKDFALDLHSEQVLWREASRLADDPEVQKELQRARQRVLVAELFKRVEAGVQFPDFEPLARERYDANPQAFRYPEQRQAAHILLNDVVRRGEDCSRAITADALMERLKQGEDFMALARAYSDDKKTASAGGVIDIWVTRGGGRVVGPFEDALFALTAVGDYSKPVHTRYGTHIVRLVERKDPTVVPYEEVRDKLIVQLRDEYLASQLTAKRSQAYPDLRTLDLEALRKALE